MILIYVSLVPVNVRNRVVTLTSVHGCHNVFVIVSSSDVIEGHCYFFSTVKDCRDSYACALYIVCYDSEVAHRYYPFLYFGFVLMGAYQYHALLVADHRL